MVRIVTISVMILTISTIVVMFDVSAMHLKSGFFKW
jgi:hypothetical protein